MHTSPTAFISYCREDDPHCIWVAELALRLRQKGINVRLDQFDVKPGEPITLYMEESVRKSDFVIIICTPRYREKADSRTGGVGYESELIAGEIVTGRRRSKFIPVLRESSYEESAPSLFKGSSYVDLTGKFDESEYAKLSDVLFNIEIEPSTSQKPISPNTSTTSLSPPINERSADSGAFFDSRRLRALLFSLLFSTVLIFNHTYIAPSKEPFETPSAQVEETLSPPTPLTQEGSRKTSDEYKIHHVVKLAKAGEPIDEICLENSITPDMLDYWKVRYSGMSPAEIRKEFEHDAKRMGVFARRP